jgi:hypothetical protein
MNYKFFSKINVAIVLPVIAGLILLSTGFPHFANAGALTGVKDTMSSLKVGSLSTHKIEFAAASSVALGSGKTYTITFPTAINEFDFTGKTLTGMTISHGGAQGTSYSGTLNAAPGAANQWGAVFSGASSSILTLTFPTGGNALSAGEKVVINYSSTNARNPNIAGPYTVTLAGTAGDTGSILLNILTDDQVLVSATVQQTLSFSLSGNTAGFGALTPGTPKYANISGTGQTGSDLQAHNAIVSTNAAGGYTLAATGTTLTYGVNTINAIGGSATAPNTSVEQFGMRAIATGGTGAVLAPYNVSNQYAFVAGAAQNVASATGPSDATTFDIRYIANAISTTEAGSYSTAITFTATANY